jgi:hypothetical protein
VEAVEAVDEDKCKRPDELSLCLNFPLVVLLRSRCSFDSDKSTAPDCIYSILYCDGDDDGRYCRYQRRRHPTSDGEKTAERIDVPGTNWAAPLVGTFSIGRATKRR